MSLQSMSATIVELAKATETLGHLDPVNFAVDEAVLESMHPWKEPLTNASSIRIKI